MRGYTVVCADINLETAERTIAQIHEAGSEALAMQAAIADAPYTASKHGIAGLTKSAAMTYAARDIRVNAVCPGLIDTGMGASLIQHFQKRDAVAPLIGRTPAARAGLAAEVAAAVIWLCSDEARYVHGHMLAVDGELATA